MQLTRERRGGELTLVGARRLASSAAAESLRKSLSRGGAAGESLPVALAALARAALEHDIRAAIRALRVAAKRRADEDRRLARAIMGHMRDAEVVDFGLDPASRPTFASLPSAATRGKDGEVPLAKVGEAVREHVAGRVRGARRCVIS